MHIKRAKPNNDTLSTDTIVVYPSEDGVHYVAHSLRTDQIGVGETFTEAVAELSRAYVALWEAHARDPSVVIERPAPPEIQLLASSFTARVASPAAPQPDRLRMPAPAQSGSPPSARRPGGHSQSPGSI